MLIVANPCFGLDFAAVAEIRSQIMQARNRGAAVLLVSEDLDELFELADRILVMFDGIVYETPDCRGRPVGDRPAHGRALNNLSALITPRSHGRYADDHPTPALPVLLRAAVRP